MSEAAKEYAKQWISPGVIMGILGWLVLLGGAWYRLTALEGKVADLSADVKASTRADQEAEKEAVRYQENVKYLTNELDKAQRIQNLHALEIRDIKIILAAKGLMNKGDL